MNDLSNFAVKIAESQLQVYEVDNFANTGRYPSSCFTSLSTIPRNQ